MPLLEEYQEIKKAREEVFPRYLGGIDGKRAIPHI